MRGDLPVDLWLGIGVLALIAAIVIVSLVRSAKRGRNKSGFEKMMEPRPHESQFTERPPCDGGGGDSS
jgi:hypothetical protein